MSHLLDPRADHAARAYLDHCRVGLVTAHAHLTAAALATELADADHAAAAAGAGDPSGVCAHRRAATLARKHRDRHGLLAAVEAAFEQAGTR